MGIQPPNMGSQPPKHGKSTTILIQNDAGPYDDKAVLLKMGEICKPTY